jgi:hypothetical protein
VAALVLAQIPDAHIAPAVAADELALVRMDHDVVNWHSVGIVPLDITTPSVPDLDRTIFARRDQPLGFAVERNACDVAGVAVEGEDRVGVRRLDVVELDGVVPCGGEVALIGRDAEAVDLRVGVGDGARADA